jgi:SAM-dependent methyltransferase
MAAECSICGGTEYIPGPNDRMSVNGLPPSCAKCGALERHRIGRKIVETIREPERFRKLNLLQLSRDRTVAQGWFLSAEVSIYGGTNSIDIQDIDRPDGCYGFVMCSHILEHVPDPRRAVRELGRVLNADGLMFLSYPMPNLRATTDDWGFPKPELHGHYRHFGRDFETEYETLLPRAYVVAVQGTDDVTGEDDLVYLITKSEFWFGRILSSCLSSRVISMPVRAAAFG